MPEEAPVIQIFFPINPFTSVVFRFILFASPNEAVFCKIMHHFQKKEKKHLVLLTETEKYNDC